VITKKYEKTFDTLIKCERVVPLFFSTKEYRGLL
jgi:hypothetical protein